MEVIIISAFIGILSGFIGSKITDKQPLALIITISICFVLWMFWFIIMKELIL